MVVSEFSSRELMGDFEEGIERGRESIIRDGGGILDEGEVNMAGCGAWEFHIEYPDGISFQRIAQTDTRIIGLQIMHPKGWDATRQKEKFFGSLVIMGRDY